MNRCRSPTGPYVHVGATSQDIVDTALMLIAKRALTPLLATSEAAAWTLFELAAGAPAHADDLRGCCCARHCRSRSDCAPRSGSTGSTRRGLGCGPCTRRVSPCRWAVRSAAARRSSGTRVALELELADPVIGWSATRVRTAELALSALGVLAGVFGKVARDVTLLAQDEIGEVSEKTVRAAARARWRTSTIPVAAVSTLACTRRVPREPVATCAAGNGDRARASRRRLAGRVGTLADLLTLTGSAASWTAALVHGLRIHTDRMAENLAGGSHRRAADLDRDRRIDRPRAGGAISPAVGSLEASRPRARSARRRNQRASRCVRPAWDAPDVIRSDAVKLHNALDGLPDGPPLLLGGSLGNDARDVGTAARGA